MKPEKVDISDHNNIVQEFEKESDRGAAVLAGSLIENYLAKYMKSNMIDDKNVDDLFHGFGPFSTFSQRFRSAYAFRLISKEQKQTLSIIQSIRNHFAHNPYIATFEDKKVAGWCRSISIKNLLNIVDDKTNDFSNLNNRTRYMISISILIADWEPKMSGMKKRSVP